MKKLAVCIITILLFYGSYEKVNVDTFKSSTKTIEVKGAVKKPGVYEVPLHATTKDILKKAGGILPKGDMTSINQAQDLPSKSVLVVSYQSEKKLISINSATLEELDTLSGVGPALAKRIVEYRTHTPFISIEDLKQVKGVGDKMFLKLKDEITL